MPEGRDQQIDAARRRGEALAAVQPSAVAARYEAATGRVTVELADGRVFAFPARALQGLETATDEVLAEVEVLGSGYGLRWTRLDADFTVAGLIMGQFGTRAWMTGSEQR